MFNIVCVCVCVCVCAGIPARPRIGSPAAPSRPPAQTSISPPTHLFRLFTRAIQSRSREHLGSPLTGRFSDRPLFDLSLFYRSLFDRSLSDRSLFDRSFFDRSLLDRSLFDRSTQPTSAG